MAKILIIDDELQLRRLLARIIGLEGYEVAEAQDCAAGLRLLRTFDPDVVLCDVKLPDGNGVELVRRIKAAVPAVEVILLTAFGNIPDGVQAIKNGAFDYITKGDDNNKILPLLARAAQKAAQQRRGAGAAGPGAGAEPFDRIIGRSEALRQAVDLARRVASTSTSVLLTGETGTGKEVFAQAIHEASPRAKGAFVAVNCSAFSKELLESELFGYRAGSFTGAARDKKGLMEEADKGTLFLDEIGEMPVELQAKLLRVLESGEFIKIGETRPTRVDLRVIAATNRDLEREIAAGNFREDLFFRLSVFRIHLPSLDQRKKDIAEYARYFVDRFAARMGRRIEAVDPEYIAALERHTWHGNVRELRNIVERSLIMAEGERLTADTLPPDFLRDAGAGEPGDAMKLAELERRHILKVLEYTGGNKTEAARLLGIGVATLYRKLESYDLRT
ncbi:MAG: sigma-54-dependent Fis family transcriptional regulator [Rikenellaceae bacterium]|nr:sigma-54-dependent Fis family transcriptional regulator [Rikenellaceae bacterium]